MRKRSGKVALVLMGAAAFGLSACKSDETDVRAFPNVEACIESARGGNLFFTEADCRTSFAEAEQTHMETAPRYDSLAVCEEQHGVGNCGGDPAASAGGGMGSIFMPMLMGYMIGSMLSRGGGMMSQPLVRSADGRFANPAGTTSLASNNGAGKMAPAAFAKGPTTMGQPPMSRAQVAQRGGFGQTAASRPAAGGTGGAARSSGG